MASGAIEAGRAVLKLTLDDKEVGDKFKTLESRLKSTAIGLRNTGVAIGAAGALIVAPFTAAISHFVKFGSTLQDMSSRTGVSVKALSELKFAAEQTGTGISTVERALRHFTREGGDPAKFDQVAASIAAIQDPAEKTRAALETFGKSGALLIPLIDQLTELQERARALGIVMSEEDAAAADTLGDALDTLKTVVGGVSRQIGAALAPALTKMVNAITHGLAIVNKFVQNHKGFVIAVGAMGVALTGLAGGFTALAIAAGAATLAVKGFNIAMAFLLKNPWIIALTGIALIITSIGSQFIDFGETTAKVARKQVKDETDKNRILAQLYKDDAAKKLAAATEANEKIQKAIAEDNRKTIAREASFNEERARQRRTELENQAADAAKKLKEAQEINRRLFIDSLTPERRKQFLKDEQVATQNVELQRQLKLLNDIDQFRQDIKIGDILKTADVAAQKLAAGRTPTRDERRALGFVQGDAGKDVKNQLVELKKHTNSLNTLVNIVRENPGGFVVGNQ